MAASFITIIIKNRKEILLYLLGTVILVLMLGFLLHMNVQSRSKARALFDNSMYEKKELDYQRSVRQLLTDWCLEDSGMMLTHTADLNGNRAYRVEIHNCRWDYLSEQDAAKLYRSISDIMISDTNNKPIEIKVIITK